MNKLYLLVLAAACKMPDPPRPEPIPLPTVTPSPTPEALMRAPASDYPAVGWDARFDTVIRHFAGPIEGKLPCKDAPGFFKALARAESGLKNSTTYQEPPPPKGPGTLSVGLLQLSFGDQKNYKIECLWESPKDLHHPVRNLACGAQMLVKLMQKRPSENVYQAGGRYWSVLRDARFWPGKTQDGFRRFSSYLKISCEEQI